jgi:pyruvate dehydrogenase E2 component (dihydrolipoamide acetyltransferase)
MDEGDRAENGMEGKGVAQENEGKSQEDAGGDKDVIGRAKRAQWGRCCGGGRVQRVFSIICGVGLIVRGVEFNTPVSRPRIGRESDTQRSWDRYALKKPAIIQSIFPIGQFTLGDPAMPVEISMPRLSDTMEEGTIVKWRVKVGDKVKAGDAVAEVETDKATMELNLFEDGTVAKVTVPEGQPTKIGMPILILAVGSESIEEAAKSAGSGKAPAPTAKPAGDKPAAKAPGTAPASAPTPAKSAEPSDDAEEPVTSGGKIKVSPLARKIAEDSGVDLSKIQGTGPAGRIIKRDVLAAANTPAAPVQAPAPTAAPSSSAKAPAPAAPAMKLESKLVPVSGMRKTIAKRLLESKTTIPHFTVTISVNMDPLMALRTTINEQLAAQKVKLSVNDFVVRAVALALVQHPLINSSWTDAGIQVHGSANIGVAVALPQEKGGGLVVPVLRDVQNKGLRAISQETKALADKAKTKGLTVDEMAEGTFTISNLGMMGVDHFEAIINPPQSAILAVGAALQKPVVRNNQIVIGHEMTCTISADHRVIDGAMAAEYLQTLKTLLENPAGLMV